MREVLLVLIMAGAFVFLYFVMSRLDRFLVGMNRPEPDEDQRPEPDCVMLSAELDDETAAREILRFRKTHPGCAVVLTQEDDKPA